MKNKQIQESIDKLAKLIYPVKIPMDKIMSDILWMPIIDTVKLDQNFSAFDKDYDCRRASYKNSAVSMKEYVLIKYSEEAVKLLDEIHNLISK